MAHTRNRFGRHPTGEIRVMTFNTAGSPDGPNDPNAWANGRSAVNVKTIQKYRPDLIGFQELQDGNLKTYKAELTGYKFILGPVSGYYPYLHNAVFWRESELDLVDSGEFWLSRTPEKYSLDWGAAYVRSATWARFRLIELNMKFVHLNTHLDYRSETARLEGGKLILEKLAQPGGSALPVILTGDFNSNPWTAYGDSSPCYQLFLDNGFQDAFISAGNSDSGVSNTFHAYEGERYFPGRYLMAWRIDWILIRSGDRKIEASSCEIIRDHEMSLYPSDHYPIVADLITA